MIAPYKRVVRFAMVGGTAYVLYQSVVFLVYDAPLLWFLPDKDVSASLLLFDHADVRLLIATLVATEVGIVAGFTGHNLWTFGDRGGGKPLAWRFGQYHGNQMISTLGILTGTVNVLTVQFGFYHFLAIPIGVAAMGAWNWTMYTQLIWRRTKRRDAASKVM